MWVQLVVALVMMALAYALMPKPPSAVPQTLGDVTAPTADIGVPIAIVFGTVKVRGPNVLWYGDLSTTTITADGK